ncbi:hypothetical protein ACI792_13090 [Blastococcus sp. SYSU DS0669]
MVWTSVVMDASSCPLAASCTSHGAAFVPDAAGHRVAAAVRAGRDR